MKPLLLSLEAKGAPQMTDKDVKEYVAKTAPGRAPSLKTVQRKAKIRTSPLVKVKRGMPKGTKIKSVHRHRR